MIFKMVQEKITKRNHVKKQSDFETARKRKKKRKKQEKKRGKKGRKKERPQ